MATVIEFPDLDKCPSDSGGRAAWYQSRLGLKLKRNGQPPVNLDTAMRILERLKPYPTLHYDTFLRRPMMEPYKTEVKDGVPILTAGRTVSKQEELELMLYMQRDLGLEAMQLPTIEHALFLIAKQNPRNCVQEWLQEHPIFDGERRLCTFFHDYYGAEQTPYTAQAGINFFRSIVARVYNPGCKVDNMIVLEGPQGIGKSYSLQVICPSEWFAEVHTDILSKEFGLGLQGKLLMEVTELDAFVRHEATTVKSVISRQNDWYRDPYERITTDHPRRCVLVGTTNKDDWHRDETGGRRFWPIRCKFVAIDKMRSMMPLLYSEALADIRFGQTWWDMPLAETQAEQLARYCDHPWRPYVESFCNLHHRGVTVKEILSLSDLRIDPQFQTPKAEADVRAILRAMKWKQHTNGKRRFWEPPEREPGEEG